MNADQTGFLNLEELSLCLSLTHTKKLLSGINLIDHIDHTEKSYLLYSYTHIELSPSSKLLTNNSVNTKGNIVKYCIFFREARLISSICLESQVKN